VAIELVFETHSTTVDNEEGRATGWLPGQLSARGRTQAQQLGRRRMSDGIAAVFSSDLARAAETATVASASGWKSSSSRTSPGRKAGSTGSTSARSCLPTIHYVDKISCEVSCSLCSRAGSSRLEERRTIEALPMASLL
jgi:bisphosphoglycerate-dependent phosphoglycerate mutase